MAQFHMRRSPRDHDRSGADQGRSGDGSGARPGHTSTARAASGGSDVRVGVLSLHNSAETKAICNAIEALGGDPVWIREENLASRIEDGDVWTTPAVDVLLNRLLVTKSDHPFDDLQLAALYGESVPVLNHPRAVSRAIHKYRAGARLAEAGVSTPDAYLARSPRRFEEWTDHLPAEAVHKRTVGTNGQGMSVVAPGEPVGPRIDGERAFLQAFVDAGGARHFDLRVYVVDDEVVGAMRRYAPEGEWRTNVALGGDVEDATGDLDAGARSAATTATDALGLDYAGVDLVREANGWAVLEVNATAGFKGLFSATGISPAPRIARVAIERAGGVVDPSRVADLRTTLDDSIPDCKPPLHESGSGDGVLGYTTHVRVSGRSGVESAVAKADTGAKRTSIDAGLAGSVGAGPLVGTTEVRSGSRSGTETRPLVDLDVRVDGDWQTVTAGVTDRDGFRYPVLLGRDVLERYTLDISRRVEE